MKKKQVNIYLMPDVDKYLAQFATDLNSSKSVITENLIIEHLMKKSISINELRIKKIDQERLNLNEMLNNCSEIAGKISRLASEG